MSLILRPLPAYEPSTELSVADSGAYHRYQCLPSVPHLAVAPAEPDCRGLVTKILEVLDGRRPITQLRGVLSETVYEATLTRLRTTPPTTIRHTLTTLHTCRPSPTAIELCGRLDTSTTTTTSRPTRTTKAYTARLDLQDETSPWTCTFWRILH
ncbi:Rv3235 family protein [Actinocrispum sp. NPDC049592]|uniref:Rv3235 family protein n=1 Tax=Actinocrispum sp. NPDC049592 TaxID=3154835 RepID=UPI003431757B